MPDGRTMLFGLPGVGMRHVEHVVDHPLRGSSLPGTPARLVQVVTTDPTAAFCPACGVVSSSVRQRRTTSPRDVPYGEQRLAVRWHKVQYACRGRRCPRKAFTEQIAELPTGARITHRLRRQLGAAPYVTVRPSRPYCGRIPRLGSAPASVADSGPNREHRDPIQVLQRLPERAPAPSVVISPNGTSSRSGSYEFEENAVLFFATAWPVLPNYVDDLVEQGRTCSALCRREPLLEARPVGRVDLRKQRLKPFGRCPVAQRSA